MAEQDFAERAAAWRAKNAERIAELDRLSKQDYKRSLNAKTGIVAASAVLAPFTGGLSLLAGGAAELWHRSQFTADGKYRVE